MVAAPPFGVGLRFEHVDEVLERVEDGTLPASISFFEIAPENFMRRGGPLPAALARIAQAVPIQAHGLTLSVGSETPPEDAFWQHLEALFERAPPLGYSDHLCFGSVENAHFHDLLPLPSTREAVRCATRRARETKARIGVPFALENVSYYAEWGPREIEDRDALAEVLEGADVRWLLDVNNLVVNAKNGVGSIARGGGPTRDSDTILERATRWLEGTPLERVSYLHVAGHEWWPEDELFVDTHGADAGPDAQALLRWVLARTGPKPVLLERDHALPTFEVLAAEVERIARAVAT